MISDKLRTFIVTELNGWNGDSSGLSDDYPLIEANVLDSLGILQVVQFVEREFGIEVLDEELVPENFGTIAGIAGLIEAKLAQ